MTEEEMKAQTLEYLIESELVRQAVGEHKVEVSAAEIDRFLDEIKAYNQINTKKN